MELNMYIKAAYVLIFGIFFGLSIATGTTLNNQARAQTISIHFTNKWGSLGNGPDQFSDNYAATGSRPACMDNQISKSSWPGITKLGCQPNPRGIALDSSGNVYVTDTIGKHIKKFDKDGNFIKEWGSPGGSPGNPNDQFGNPYDIAADSSGHVYIADDCCTHRVAKFSDNGTYITKWGQFSTNPNGNGTFDTPTAIAVDPIRHFVYVGDGYKHIQKFDSNGTFIKKWGGPGAGANGTFYEDVGGIAVDRNGTIYATNPFMDSVQKFDSNGTFIKKWGVPGHGDGQFGCGSPPSSAQCYDNGPEGIAVDRLGHVYVVDTINNRIEMFDSNGTFITKWGSEGSLDGQFDGPTAVAVDRDNNVYVSDSGNHRIQEFAVTCGCK